MPVTSGTSVVGHQLILALAGTDTVWTFRVDDPSFPLNLQSKYYGTLSVEINVGTFPQPFQLASYPLWTAARLSPIIRYGSGQHFLIMRWRYSGIPWGATSS